MTAKTPVNRATARAKLKHTMKNRCLMRLTSPDSDTKRIFRDFLSIFLSVCWLYHTRMGKMSYLCRCGKPIVVGSSRFGANPVGFATAFQQAVLRLPHPFDRFFHISPQNGISIVTADDLRFFPHFRSNFPQSFPHIVENSCVKIRDHVVPPRKNMLVGRHFSVTTYDIPTVSFCHPCKILIFIDFSRLFSASSPKFHFQTDSARFST